jgi:hypothetical protein
MTLPNPDRAVVDAAKVRDYLLSPEHPVGRFKAVVLQAAGYRRDDWQQLQRDLLATAHLEPAAVAETVYGRKFEIPAILGTSAGRPLSVTVVWLVRRHEDFGRLVTVYPRAKP